MSTPVVLGDSRLLVLNHNVSGFEEALRGLDLFTHVELEKNGNGDIVGLSLLSDRLIEREEVEALHPLVECGSYIGLETAWGDDAWRYIFTKKGVSQRTVPVGARAC